VAHRGPGASSIWRRTAQSSRGSCRSWQWRIYGVLAAFVTQHASEIGIRLALGAQTADVMHLVLRRGMGLALVGVLLGLMTAWVMTRLMKTLLFGVGVADPMIVTVIALMLLCVALAACWIPARRAARVDPLVALRHD